MQAGRIINISSISGIRAGVGRAVYRSTKADVDTLARQFAVEFGMRVSRQTLLQRQNAATPDTFEIPLAHLTHSQGIQNSHCSQNPLRRHGNPEEIAFTVGILTSKNTGHITGHTLPFDGGFSAAGLYNI
ncbi:SDR family oxidoreductase [Nocardia carnea]|uniref:SDR family oxidoreductase n=1 Tax=Nocardia carnea TaxID=37328 RepID=UPI002456F742|nr:SDR family oxidoreductase [Nocardia carnea]